MAQDLREMFKNGADSSLEKLGKGHKGRFRRRLEKAFPETSSGRSSYLFLKIAAVLIIALAVGWVFLGSSENTVTGPAVVDIEDQEEQRENRPEEIPERQFRLSQVSPEYKRVEDYYLASLDLELAKININDGNRELIKSFMEQLADLDKEYLLLNAELEREGPNEQSIEAMIINLQLRLELLYKLKNKLNEINKTKNERYENHQV